MSALATLAKMLGVRQDLAEEALHSERAASVALSRRNLLTAAGAMASGTVFGFAPAGRWVLYHPEDRRLPLQWITLHFGFRFGEQR